MRPNKRLTWVFLLSFGGLALMQSPGCSNEAENLARTGEDPSLKGLCVAAEDDGNPCTIEGCQGETNPHIPVAGLPCGLNNDLTCNSLGECGGCTTADECGVSTYCLPWACDVDKICRLTPAANGLPLQTQIPNDCKQQQCDGTGGEKIVNDDSDVPQVDCQISSCVGGTPMFTPAAQGTACTAGGGNSCDGEGNCVQCNTDADCGPMGIFCDPKSNTCFSCTDGVKNGDESDIDCGGDRCAKCAQGKGCNSGKDCSGALSCADNVCCSSACTGPCQACNLAETPGVCNLVPDYTEDVSYGSNMSCLAADGLACRGGNCGKALGQPCSAPADCASGRCADPDGNGANTCVKTLGDLCTENVECFNNKCVGEICVP